jgi:hypothetical protein
MPHILNNIVVVTAEELVPDFFKLDTLMKNIKRYESKPYGIKRVQKGGNGRPMLVAFDSLDAAIQTKLGDPRKQAHILERFYQVDGEGVIYFRDYRFPDGSALDRKHQDKYVLNASMLKALFALKQAREMEHLAKGCSTKGLLNTLCADAISYNTILAAKRLPCHTLPENPRRFKDAMSRFEKNGYESLISGRHKNDNSRKVTDSVISLLNNMFAKDPSKPTAIEVHRRYNAFINGFIQIVNKETGEYYIPSEYANLSAATVTNYLLTWKNAIGNEAARSGNRQVYMGKFKPHYSFERPKYAGTLISIDDRQPPFKTESGKRVWFYNGIDLASDFIACAVYAETKSDEDKNEKLIIDFYRQLVRNYAEWGFNLPDGLEAELSLNSSYVDTFLKPGAMFHNVRIEANNARGKRCERHWEELRYGIEKKRIGWIGRPHARKEFNQAGPNKVPKLPYYEVVNNAIEDIEAWNEWPHYTYPEAVEDFRAMEWSPREYKTRWEVFCETQNPNLKPTNYQGFLPYLGYKETTSCHAGILRFRSTEYIIGNNGQVETNSDRLISCMEKIEGRDIDIYWLDGNDGKVLAAHIYIGTQYICEAVIKPTSQRGVLEQTDDDRYNFELFSKYKTIIETFGRRQYAELEPVAYINDAPRREKTFKMPGIKRNSAMDKPAAMRALTQKDFDAFSMYDNDLDEGGVAGFAE